jgi:hypothetical protein
MPPIPAVEQGTRDTCSQKETDKCPRRLKPLLRIMRRSFAGDGQTVGQGNCLSFGGEASGTWAGGGSFRKGTVALFTGESHGKDLVSFVPDRFVTGSGKNLQKSFSGHENSESVGKKRVSRISARMCFRNSGSVTAENRRFTIPAVILA